MNFCNRHIFSVQFVVYACHENSATSITVNGSLREDSTYFETTETLQPQNNNTKHIITNSTNKILINYLTILNPPKTNSILHIAFYYKL